MGADAATTKAQQEAEDRALAEKLQRELNVGAPSAAAGGPSSAAQPVSAVGDLFDFGPSSPAATPAVGAALQHQISGSAGGPRAGSGSNGPSDPFGAGGFGDFSSSFGPDPFAPNGGGGDLFGDFAAASAGAIGNGKVDDPFGDALFGAPSGVGSGAGPPGKSGTQEGIGQKSAADILSLYNQPNGGMGGMGMGGVGSAMGMQNGGMPGGNMMPMGGGMGRGMMGGGGGGAGVMPGMGPGMQGMCVFYNACGRS